MCSVDGVGMRSCPCIRGPNGTKRQKAKKSCFLSLFVSYQVHLLWPSDLGAPASRALRLGYLNKEPLVLWPWDSQWATPPASWCPAARSRMWDVPASIRSEPTPIASERHRCIDTDASYGSCFSGEPRLTHDPNQVLSPITRLRVHLDTCYFYCSIISSS